MTFTLGTLRITVPQPECTFNKVPHPLCSQVCSDWYVPTAMLMESFVVLAIAIILIQLLQACLRREDEVRVTVCLSLNP